jgi:hypothetical protein
MTTAMPGTLNLAEIEVLGGRVANAKKRCAHVLLSVEEMQPLLATARREVEGGWIPIAERLPENGWKVLTYVPSYGVTECLYGADYHKDYNGWWTSGVTHWMPLPKPPEAQGEE